jgi:hypothetical protein
LVVYLVAVIGVLIASAVTGDVGTDDGGDVFAADKAWWFVTLLTIGYMVSRGLAKSGTRSRDSDPRTGDPRRASSSHRRVVARSDGPAWDVALSIWQRHAFRNRSLLL